MVVPVSEPAGDPSEVKHGPNESSHENLPEERTQTWIGISREGSLTHDKHSEDRGPTTTGSWVIRRWVRINHY